MISGRIVANRKVDLRKPRDTVAGFVWLDPFYIVIKPNPYKAVVSVYNVLTYLGATAVRATWTRLYLDLADLAADPPPGENVVWTFASAAPARMAVITAARSRTVQKLDSCGLALVARLDLYEK